jgi:hypothetical protein
MKLYSIVAALFVVSAHSGAIAFPGQYVPPAPGPATVSKRTIGRTDAAFEIFSEGAETILVICKDMPTKTLAANGVAILALKDLAPSTSYECSAMGFRGALNPSPPGPPADLSFVTLGDQEVAPGPVKITGREIGPASATFELSSPGSSGILAWCVALGGAPGGVRYAVTPGATKETASLRVDGLVCGTTYECFFKNENDESNPLRNSVSFVPAPPTAPLPAPRLRSLKKTKTTATFATTTVPCAASYKVACRAKGDPKVLNAKVSRSKTAATVELANLRAGTAYACSIAASTGAGKTGRALTVSFSTTK